MRAVWIIVALCACKSDHRGRAVKPDLVNGSGNVAEARLGPPNPGGDRELAFVITKVYERQQPAADAPYHADGGTWTYVDARLALDPAATFGVGMPALKAGADGFGGFDKIWLVPTTSDAGGHFVAAFAKAFHVEVPPMYPGKLAPLQVPIAVLGTGTGPADNGYAGTGTWNAMKLFLSAGDIDSAELFFNLSVADKQGVFSEKDEDYNADDARVLAIALRDGKPPPRTPENDPTLAARPLALKLGKQIGAREGSVLGNSPKRAILAATLEDHAVLTAVDLATGTVKELYRTPDRLWMGTCEPTAQHCVVQETKSADRHAYASNDPAKLLVLDGDKVTPLDVPGGGASPSATAISPSGRYVIASGERAATIIVDRTTHKATPPKATHDFREVIGWKSDAVAVVSIESFSDTHAPKTFGEWHLDTGALEPLTSTPMRADATSPDGSRTIAFDAGKVTVTAKGGAARTLQLDPRDARAAEPGCCKWLDNRYVSFPARTLGVIDTDAMKIAFVPETPDEETRATPLPGAMQALVTKGEATYLAQIVP
jgi:hypothetical protein